MINNSPCMSFEPGPQTTIWPEKKKYLLFAEKKQ